jgi:gluconolactonase
MIFRRKAGLISLVLLLVAIKSFSRGHYTGRADSVKVTAAGAVPKQISSQFKFTEGPAVNKKGDIYFTDQPNDKIWKYDTDGKLSLYMEKTGRSNGLYFDKKGNLISCADEKDELWSISPKGKLRF